MTQGHLASLLSSHLLARSSWETVAKSLRAGGQQWVPTEPLRNLCGAIGKLPQLGLHLQRRKQPQVQSEDLNTGPSDPQRITLPAVFNRPKCPIWVGKTVQPREVLAAQA